MTHALTLYARREPSTLRPHLHTGAGTVLLTGKRDVVLYRDPQCKKACAVYPWHRASRPRRNSTRVMHNCFRYRLEWLGELQAPAGARAPHLPGLPSRELVAADGQRWKLVLLF